MADPPPYPGPDDDTDDGMPRWVKVSGTIAIVLFLLFVGIHLAGGGFRGHMHGRDVHNGNPPGGHSSPSSDPQGDTKQP